MPEKKLKLVFYVSDAETGEKVFDWQQIVLEVGDSNADLRAACEMKADEMSKMFPAGVEVPPSMAFAVESQRIKWFKEMCEAAGVIVSKFVIAHLRGYLAQGGFLPPTPQHDRIANEAQQQVAEKSSDEDVFRMPKEN